VGDREAVLAAVGKALAMLADERAQDADGPSVPMHFEPVEQDLPADTDALWQRFEERLTGLGGRVVEPGALEELLESQVCIDRDALPLLAGIPWVLTDDPWEAGAGITLAEVAVAETGSLLVSAGPGRRRLASLAPPVHVALVRRESIVSTLEEGLARLGDRTSVLISGPSRTADIEGVLVRGVHGPRELWVIPI